MRISILTLFPEMFVGPLDYSIIKRAKEKGLVNIELINIRDFASDRYRTVDGHPYGGGTGMILRVDILDAAISNSKNSYKAKSGSARQISNIKNKKVRTILLDPQGTPYNQARAKEFSQLDHLILVCGHYEGVDERIRTLVDEEVSIGDYVVTGGEIPAMVVADSVVRLLPHVLKKKEATGEESFSPRHTNGILEYPQYTYPQQYKGMTVPPVLLSGNHRKITEWRQRQSRVRTQTRRPDLMKSR